MPLSMHFFPLNLIITLGVKHHYPCFIDKEMSLVETSSLAYVRLSDFKSPLNSANKLLRVHCVNILFFPACSFTLLPCSGVSVGTIHYLISINSSFPSLNPIQKVSSGACFCTNLQPLHTLLHCLLCFVSIWGIIKFGIT